MYKQKQPFATAASFLLFFALLLCLLLQPAQVLAADSLKTESVPADSSGEKNSESQEMQDTEKMKEHFQVTMLDVKQGLCILVESDGHYMLYDGGGKKRSSYVVSYLKKHKITKLDYIFASHYDEDHISGLAGVMNALQVQTAVTPDYEADSACYTSFQKNLEKNKVSEVHPEVDEVYPFGHAKIHILYADPEAELENNRSTAIRITCKDCSCLITGDAEALVERDLIASGKYLTSDLYIAGHHGSATSNTEEFIKAVSPAAAFISVGKDNTYGHPAPETMTYLREQNCAVYRTDKQKEVTMTFDGSSISFSQDPWISMNDSAENASAASASENADVLDPFATDPTASGDSDAGSVNRSLPADANVMTYILNVNTGKFHYPECKSAKQTKDKNKRELECTRDDLIAQGYSPCQNCNP